uniref:cytochrome c oxidase subunit 7A2, mitochondrial-like isoform X2 n=1 Tax=Gasterosteus aculeatus aculeatus TaxID=481459 RepID=UPI001A98EB65|nr:cytochrome c oxidase subunit 7A2, mitochondrial-like isoform X2 [Gasterosteus aculeatus aculeatus]
MFRQLVGLRQLSSRTVTSSASRPMENSVKQKQKLFQEDNGLPVHLKGGTRDALLYRVTMTLTVFGAAFVVYELFSAAMPRKPH